MNLNHIFRFVDGGHNRLHLRINGAVLFVVCLIVIVYVAGEDLKGGDPAVVNRASGADKMDGIHGSESDQSERKATEKSNEAENSAVQLYRRLFKQKHASHLDAIRKIMQLGSYEKQFKMISIILNKLFTVMSQARIRLMEAGFTPGDAFPTVEEVRDALSIVLENTAFLGEIALRLPDITHLLLRNNSEWQLAVQWSVGFCNDTKIFDGSEYELLNLMAQELGVIERSPEFHNPYREDTKLEQAIDAEAEKLLREKLKEAKIKERKEKKKRRGPKLTAPQHNEL